MSRRLRLIAIACLTCGIGGIGLAGNRWSNSLTMPSSSSATGGFAETFNTPNLNEYVECGSNRSTGFCTFVDANNNNFGCFTTDAGHIAVIRSMTPEAWFYVMWNELGQCTYVLGYASSRTTTKVP